MCFYSLFYRNCANSMVFSICYIECLCFFIISDPTRTVETCFCA